MLFAADSCFHRDRNDKGRKIMEKEPGMIGILRESQKLTHSVYDVFANTQKKAFALRDMIDAAECQNKGQRGCACVICEMKRKAAEIMKG